MSPIELAPVEIGSQVLSTILSTGGKFLEHLGHIRILRLGPFPLVKALEIIWEKMGIFGQNSLARRCSTTELHPQPAEFGGQQ